MFAVLNSRFRIVGGRGTYLSTNDMMAATMPSLQVSVLGTDPSSGSEGSRPSHFMSNRALDEHIEMKSTKVRARVTVSDMDR
jgi:hypothetical protein